MHPNRLAAQVPHVGFDAWRQARHTLCAPRQRKTRAPAARLFPYQQVNGAANAAAIAAAKAAGVPRFAYVSAHIPQLPGFDYVMEGYVKGKQAAEQELFKEYPEGVHIKLCM